MKRVFGGVILALVLVLSVVTMASAMQVYLKDGSILDARSYSRSDGMVTVQVNRDIVLEFGEDEIDLKRTAQAAKAAKRRAAAKAAAVPVAEKADKVGTAPAAAKPAPATAQPAATPPAKPAASATPAKTVTPAATPAAKPAAPAPAVTPAAKPAAPATAPAAAKPATPAPAATPAVKPPPPAPVAPSATPPAAPPAVKPAAPAGEPQVPKTLPVRPQMQQPPPAKELPKIFFAFLVIMMFILLVVVASGWKLFEKAGVAGWKFIVPFYNVWVLVEICGKPWWWFLLILFVPGVNIVFNLLLSLALAERFGKSSMFGIGIFFLPFVFWPMLAFSDASYTAP